MENNLKKSLSKPLLIFAIVIVLIVVIPGIILNVILTKQKSKIEKNISKIFSKKFSVGQLFFLPPNFLIIKNISIFSDEGLQKKKFVFIPLATITISLPKLIKKNPLAVSSIRLYKPEINYSEDLSFFKESPTKAKIPVGFLQKVNGVNLYINRGVFKFGARNSPYPGVILNSVLKIKDNVLVIDGSVAAENISLAANRFRGRNSKKKALTYRLKFRLEEKLFSIDRIELKMGNVYLKLWGSFANGILRLDGFSSIKGLFKEAAQKRAAFNISDKFKELSKRQSPQSIISAKGAEDLNIYDIGCQINFGPWGAQIEDLSFSIDDINVFLKGNISSFDKISADLAISLYSNFQRKDGSSELSWIREVRVSAELDEGKLNGELDFEFLEKKNGKNIINILQSDFKNLAFSINKPQSLEVHSEKADFYYLDGNTGIEYRAFLDDFDANFDFQTKSLKFVEFNSGIYGGLLEGEGYVDISESLLRCAFTVDIEGASADKFASLLEYFSGISGKLSSHLYYRNHPSPVLEGTVDILKGSLDRVEYLMWLPTFFGIPELEKIDFKNSAVSFLLAKEVISLNKIEVNSESVKLKGYFDLYANDLVAGKATVILPKRILQSSPRQRILAKRLGKDAVAANFDFQFSGTFEAINFKWLESELRDKIKSYIPDFIERSIERKIEKSLDASRQ